MGISALTRAADRAPFSDVPGVHPEGGPPSAGGAAGGLSRVNSRCRLCGSVFVRVLPASHAAPPRQPAGERGAGMPRPRAVRAVASAGGGRDLSWRDRCPACAGHL